MNTPGTFTCDCPPGYNRIVDSGGAISCDNIDECVAFPGICGMNGVCTDTVGSFTCACEVGYYVVFGHTGCVRCPPGHYIVDGGVEQDDCLVCPVDTYSNATDVTECIDCPPESSTSGTTAATVCDCNPGFVYDPARELCPADCALGELRVEDYACTPCPTGTYGGSPGVCPDCPAHRTTFSTGQLSCVCAEGFIDAASSSSGVDGSGCAKTCEPGWFVEPISDTCIQCYDDTYKNVTSTAESCTPCPLSGMRSPRGSDSLADCQCSGGLEPNYELGKCDLFCDPGSSRPVPYTECYSCGTGFFSDAVNQEDCTACPARTTSPPQSTSLDACVCQRGAYHPKGLAGVACSQCPDGAECEGGDSQPTARPGYFPAGEDNFVACSPSEVSFGWLFCVLCCVC